MRAISETKQNLINVTRRMIDKGGINSVSMRDIGKEMNLSRSAVYRHFKNKEDLLAAVVTENFEMLGNEIDILIGKIDVPKQLISSILFTYYNFGIMNQEHYQLMFARRWDKNQYPDIYVSAIKRFKIIEQCLEKVQEQECNVKKPVKELIAMIFAFIHGLVELNFSGHSEPEKGLDDSISLINSFLNMIYS